MPTWVSAPSRLVVWFLLAPLSHPRCTRSGWAPVPSQHPSRLGTLFPPLSLSLPSLHIPAMASAAMSPKVVGEAAPPGAAVAHDKDDLVYEIIDDDQAARATGIATYSSNTPPFRS